MPRTSSDRPSVAYVLRSYPRLSQTFIVDEIRALERLGVNICIFAITEPREPVVQPEVADVRAPVVYLDRPDRTHRSSLASSLGLAVRSPRRYLEALRFTAGSGES